MKKKNSSLLLGFTLTLLSAILVFPGWREYTCIVERRSDDRVPETQLKEDESKITSDTLSGNMKSHELKRANKLYDQGKYDEALVIYRRILDDYLEERKKGNWKDESAIESVYLKLARCKARLGNLDGAVKELRAVIDQAKRGNFSLNTGARLQLEIGNLYLRKKDYLTALEEFEKVSVSYSETKYAQFASEEIKEIEEWKVGEIKGLAILEGESDQTGIIVSLFNGESLIQVQTDSEGVYAIPVFKSTPGTFVSIFFTKNQYVPQIENILLTDKKGYCAPEVILSATINPKFGVLAGVVFTPVVGGEMKPQFGINKYHSAHEIVVTGEDSSEVYSTKTDENGIYILTLPEGSYLLTSPWGKAGNIVIKNGSTTIHNIGSAPLLID